MRILVLVLILASLAAGQGVDRPAEYVIDKFTGLENNFGPKTMNPGGALTAHNVDLSRNGINSVTPRNGVEYISTRNGQDSIIAMAPVTFKNSGRKLLFVTDSAGVGYGNIYVTAAGSRAIGSATRIATQWPVTEDTRMAFARGRLYAVNGASRGITWNGETVRDFPIRAPFEMKVTPLLSDTVFVPSGVMFYVLRYDCSYVDTTTTPDSTKTVSYEYPYITMGTQVDHQRVLLSGFQWPAADSSVLAKSTGFSSIHVEVFKNENADNVIRKTTRAYIMHSLGVHTTKTSKADLDTAVISDPHPADWTAASVYFVNAAFKGRDSSGVCSNYLGAPVFLASANTGHLYSDTNIIGYEYVYTKQDTLIGAESDSSRGMTVTGNKSAGEKSYTIGLPPLPSSEAGMVYNVYRRAVRIVSWRRLQWPMLDGYPIDWRVFVGSLPDTIMGDDHCYKVGTVVPSTTATTVFVDTLHDDSAILRDVYRDNNVPAMMNTIVVANGKVFGDNGTQVVYASLDSIQKWDLFDVSPIDDPSSDVITSVWPARTALQVATATSIFNLPWSTMNPELSSHIGCIGPAAHASMGDAEFFLSMRGFEMQKEGMALERTFNTSALSSQIRNFRSMPTEKKRAVSVAAWPKENKLFVCSPDTNYVYDIDAEGWTTSDVVFSDWCLYDTVALVDAPSGQEFYFVPRGTSRLYRMLGDDDLMGVDYDSGGVAQFVDFTYRTGRMKFPDGDHGVIDAVSVWGRPDVNSAGTSTDIAKLIFRGDASSDISDTAVIEIDNAVRAFSALDIGSTPSVFFDLTFCSRWDSTSQTWFTSSIIDEIDIWARSVQKVR